jgi:ubiquinone/menaquinone biosynthesis C-methylase UbiE
VNPVAARDQARAWQSYARSYDQILPVLPFYQEVVARHVAALLQPDVRRVIDIGAGTGNVATDLIANGVHVTAVDHSPAMLERLRAKVPPASRDLLCCVETDAASLSVCPTSFFDGANILLALFAMSAPPRTLAEIIRVLRPGGRVVLTEPKRDFQIRVLLDFAEQFLREHDSYEQLRHDWERVRNANLVVDPARQDTRLAVEEIAEILGAAGFVITDMHDSHLGQCATLWAQKQPNGP